MLVVASLQNNKMQLRKALEKIDYHLKRNATAYKSHRLNKEKQRKAG